MVGTSVKGPQRGERRVTPARKPLQARGTPKTFGGCSEKGRYGTASSDFMTYIHINQVRQHPLRNILLESSHRGNTLV